MSSWNYPADSVLPWQSGVAEDVRFKRLLVHGLGIFLVLALLMPFFPVPDIVTPPIQKDKKYYTRLIIEKKPIPPPVVVKPKEVKVTPIKKVAKAIPKVKPVKPKPVVKTKPVDLMKQARDKAATTGVLAFADDLAAMRQDVDVSRVKRSNLSRGAAQAESTQRNLLAAKAKSNMAGISSVKLSQDTGGVALSARETTLISAPTGTVTAGVAQAAASDNTQYSGRSSESVRRVMDANKGAIYAIYNRALRKDSTLAGKVLFRLVIEPAGNVSKISLLSSELTNEALVKKILSRIKMINFGAEAVEQTDVNYSFDFLPY